MLRRLTTTRGVFHPAHTSFLLAVLLLLLTLLAPVAAPAKGMADGLCFPETGRCISPLFSAYWRDHGGLVQQGYPLSDLIDEVSAIDGRTYRVQYFERARFEYHPGNAGTPYAVLLGLLGREQLMVQNPKPSATPPPTGAPAAARASGAPSATPPPTGAPAAARASGALDAEESAFLTLINAYRAQNSLRPLTVSPTLTRASEWLSADMAAKNYFSHTDSLGRDPFARMCAFGYCADAYKGENIAAGNATAQATFVQWKNSPEHNANMLNPNYTVIGIDRASGGTHQWYWTTNFGSAP